LHEVKETIMVVTSSAAERIADDVLSSNDEILAISIIDMKGNIIAAKSKESFKKAFRLTADGDKYGATLAVGIFSLVNEVKELFGEAEAISTIHKNCKLVMLPIPSYQILVGLVLQRDYNIASKIEKLFADAAK
jgi:hypothetical protein